MRGSLSPQPERILGSGCRASKDQIRFLFLLFSANMECIFYALSVSDG